MDAKGNHLEVNDRKKGNVSSFNEFFKRAPFNRSLIMSGGEVLCASLRERSFAVVKLPESERETISDFNRSCTCFFGLEQKIKQKLAGDLRHVNGQLVGYQQNEDREFLETRMDSDGDPLPLIPSKIVPGYEQSAAEVYKMMTILGREVLSAIARSLCIDPQVFLSAVDVPGEMTASVLRICHYGKKMEGSEQASAPKGSDSSAVAFGEHTDSSFVTLALCSLVPGLQIKASDTNTWCLPEENRDSLDVIVFVGEFMQVLTKSAYKAAVHRVLRPSAESPEDRVSFPFLLRGRHQAILNTSRLQTQYPFKGALLPIGFEATLSSGAVAWKKPEQRENGDQKTQGGPQEGQQEGPQKGQQEGPQEGQQEASDKAFPLLELDGMPMKELHMFMELRRRKQVHEAREIIRAEQRGGQTEQGAEQAEAAETQGQGVVGGEQQAKAPLSADEMAELEAEIEDLRGCCRGKPMHVGLRYNLGEAYEEAGNMHAALGEMRCAVAIKATYRKAVDGEKRILATLQAAGMEDGELDKIRSDIPVPSAPPLAPAVASDATSPQESASNLQFKAMQATECLALGGFEKARGLLTECITQLTKQEQERAAAAAKPEEQAVAADKAVADRFMAELFACRGEAHLGLLKYVAANVDCGRAIALEPSLHRAHLTRGRALARMLLGKAASSANAERGEQAKNAFTTALQDEQLTGEERAKVESEAGELNARLTELNPACVQQ
jgi:isopenicillin N synthase-like dioxygenase